MDILQLYQDHHIQYWTSGKNVAAGWINIRCPFCPNDSNHLGWNLRKEYYNCWKCGPKATKQVLGRILRLDDSSLSAILRQYGYRSHTRVQGDAPVVLGTKRFMHPGNAGPMNSGHKAYLSKRGFDPDALEADWGLLGTGPISLLSTGSGAEEKTIDFKFRIVAPINWGGREVSFQARDITNRHPVRYITCPRDREVVFHKHILYGKQENWTDFAIVCEGITDVWRMGPVSVATFGIEFTANQVHVLAANFERVAVLYDDEPQAISQADRLVAELRFRGVRAKRFTIVGDPGGLTQEEADRLVDELRRSV